MVKLGKLIQDFVFIPKNGVKSKKLLFFQVMTIGTTAISFLSEMIWNY